MAHHVEPMDIDGDFDNKENSLHHNNVLPFTEKGYEELDVSELNMKLRYSITPASSPMSQSCTANCLDNRSLETGDELSNVTVNENSNLTRSLNSTLTKNDNVLKSLKALPLQAISTEQFADNNRGTSVLRQLDSTITQDNANVTVTVSRPSDIDDNLSLPSSSSSVVQTPEATTPTKDIPKNDGGSPIMRGLKSVLNMFRSSQSPIPPVDSEDNLKPEVPSPAEPPVLTDETKSQLMLASTPIAAHRKKDVSPTKRSTPHKDSLVFNDDLEKELLWKDETTILFSQERIPIHKLLFQQSQNSNKEVDLPKRDVQDDMNSTVEYMDISYNESIRDRTMTDIQVIGNRSECTIAGESDGEFVDCETTFIKNESLIEDKDKTPVVDTTINLDLTKEIETTNENTSASRLKQIILNTTQDILDATLSITPEDLLPDGLEKATVVSGEACVQQNTNSEEGLQKINDTTISVVNQEHSSQISEQAKLPILNETIDVASLSMVGQKVEDTSVTKIIENEKNPLLNQTVDISRPLTDEENKQDPNVSHIKENVSGVSLEKQGDILSISSTETLLQDDKLIEHCENISTKTAENSILASLAPGTVDIAINSTSIPDEVNVSLKEASMTDLPADIPLPDEDDIEKELNIPADTTTEPSTGSIGLSFDLVDDVKVTSEIPEIIHKIPLEGTKIKLENDETSNCNLISSNVLSQSNTGTFEGGNHIQNSSVFLEENGAEPTDVKMEKIQSPEEPQIVNVNVLAEESQIVNADVSEIRHSVTIDALPKVPLIANFDLVTEAPEPIIVNVDESEIPPTSTTDKLHEVPNVDVSPKESQILKVDVLPEAPQIVNINEDPQIFKVDPVVSHVAKVGEPETLQIVNTDILTATVSTLTVVDNETLNEREQVPHDVEEINRMGNFTVSLNASVTCDIGQNVMQTDVTPMNINECVIELKPLPDIINQTIAMPNVELLESVANNSEQEQPVPLVENLENVTDEVLHTEVLPEAITKVVPEFASDLNVTDSVNPASEITDVLNETLLITTAIEKEIKNPISKVTDTSSGIISNDQKHNAGEMQAFNADNVSVSKNIKNEDEQIILSENNSPFVSVTVDYIPEMKSDGNYNVQNFNEQSVLTGKTVYTPPASPPITSKGYNFNFEDIDDPFATKTKIRLSPTLDTPTKVEPKVSTRSAEKPIPKKDMHSRRKTQSERKRSVAPKRKFNSDLNSGTSEKTAEKPVEKFAAGDTNLEPENVALGAKNITIKEKLIYEGEKIVDVPKEVLKSSQQEENKLGNIEEPSKTSSNEFTDTVESDTIKTSNKTTSSSEQSTYYSADTSSSESLLSRNVFNLPEIDDVNFNPFATKSKMRESPPPSLDVENPFATKSKIENTPESSMIMPGKDDKDIIKSVSPDDKMETELMEKDGSGNLSHTTNSSKATDDRNTTMREINTEDEDTIEGPFLEAEDFNSDDKISDFYGENIDMMQFGDLPTHGNEDNGELFIDAEAFEFLLNQNQCNTVADSGKESLFLKFDPLFAKKMSSVTSDGVVAALSKIQNRQSTPTKSVKSPQKEVVSPIAGPSNLNATIDMNVSEELNDELNVTVSKPMMVVPPAVNTVTSRNKSLTPNRSNRRSITFTSPAMAVIDRLLSLSGNTSLLQDTTVTQTTREQNEADLALTQLRELLAEKEVHVYTLRSESNELKDRLSTLESHLKSLETESQERLKKINDLNERLAEKTKINKSMAAVVEEYERTIASLISETAQDKKRHAEERIKLINERDEQTAHLASMEVSFSDLHSKYEKSKQVILNCKANEDAYKKSIKEFEENLHKMQNNYELLKQHATSKLNHANQELEKMNKTHEAEVLKLNAMIKRKELHITSLEESLAQKTKANEELTAICDELINKVG